MRVKDTDIITNIFIFYFQHFMLLFCLCPKLVITCITTLIITNVCDEKPEVRVVNKRDESLAAWATGERIYNADRLRNAVKDTVFKLSEEPR